MGFLSQGGQIGIRTQAAKGAYLDPGAASPAGVFMRITSGAMTGNRDLIVPDPEIGGIRDIPDMKLGPIAYVGQYNFLARLDAIATLLRAALGGTSVDATTGTPINQAYTHTFGTANVLPWLSVEEGIANAFETFRYTDMKVNTLHLECDSNAYLKGTVGMVGITQLAGATRTVTPAWDNTPLLVGPTVTVQYNSVTLPAKTFSIDINNNLETDDFRLGSLVLGDVTEKRREINFGVTIRPADNTIWRQAMYGTSAATGPGGVPTKQPVVVTVTSYENVGTTTTPYKLQITVPNGIIVPFDLNPSGDDVLQHDLQIRSVRPNPASDIVTTVVTNDLATVY